MIRAVLPVHIVQIIWQQDYIALLLRNIIFLKKYRAMGPLYYLSFRFATLQMCTSYFPTFGWDATGVWGRAPGLTARIDLWDRGP